jgi:hypothetical protein
MRSQMTTASTISPYLHDARHPQPRTPARAHDALREVAVQDIVSRLQHATGNVGPRSDRALRPPRRAPPPAHRPQQTAHKHFGEQRVVLPLRVLPAIVVPVLRGA